MMNTFIETPKISVDTSIRLGIYFGLSEKYFLNLQNVIDIRKIRNRSNPVASTKKDHPKGVRFFLDSKKKYCQLSSICRQLKMTAADGKQYNTDCLNQEGINLLLMLLPAKEKIAFTGWLKGLNDPIDEQSKKRLQKCVDWQKIDKKDYLSAMEESPLNSEPIKKLISAALTNKITDREIFMKGIDYSYYYETIEE